MNLRYFGWWICAPWTVTMPVFSWILLIGLFVGIVALVAWRYVKW